MKNYESAWDPFGAAPPDGNRGVNFGGGVNSTALLLALHERGLRPWWVCFSDTGDERPETYRNIDEIEKWCQRVEFPFARTRWIRRDGTFESISDNCMRTGYLPSKAYGYAGCAYKWKIQPLQKWRKQNGHSPTTVAIAYDAGESRRLKNARKRACADAELDSDEQWWYPLVGMGMDRQSCVDLVVRHGLTPVKSACFMCPNMRPAEWDDLRRRHPDLFDRAEAIQMNAERSGNARTANLFRSYKPDDACICNADGCLTDSKEA